MLPASCLRALVAKKNIATKSQGNKEQNASCFVSSCPCGKKNKWHVKIGQREELKM